MPWSNQGGGGPWGGGGGGQGPWGRGPSGPGGMQQPNLEDILRRFQEQLKRLLPGGGGGNGRLIGLLIGVAVLIWLATGAYRVQPDEQGVALIFGKWVGTTGPGLNYNLPSPIGYVYTPKVTRVSRVEIGFRSQSELGRPQSGHDVPVESLMLSGDENVIDVQFVVFWLIKDAGEYLFNIRDGDGTVKDVAEASMREIIGQTNFEYARTQGRVTIEHDTQKLIQSILDTYGAGILVTGVRLQKVDPPEGAINAFRDVQAARADKERAINEAQGYLNEITQKAQGMAEQVLKESEAYKSERTNQAEGDTQRFNLIYAQYLKNKDVTTRRIYLDTMSIILADMDKVMLGRGAGSQTLPLLPLEQLLKRERAAQEPAAAAKSGKGGQP